MNKFMLSLVALFFAVAATAQNSVNLKGKILDSKTQVPLEAVTVYLTSAKDSTVIDYTLTDKNGIFDLKTRKSENATILKISYIGYAVMNKALKEITESIDFGTLRLEESENMLGEVVVQSEAPPIRIKNDTLEFNASSFKVRPDANVEALLKQLPGLEIDADGKITVNGKEVNQILVNGKPFFDKDGKIALQNLPSDIINKVQITDTKTKKEELTGAKASSNNASINLTIDADKNKGLFGKVMGGYGTDDRYETSLMINYFKDKRKISLLGSTNNINSTGFSMNEIFDSMGGGRGATSIYTNDNGSFGINGMRFGGSNGITRSHIGGLNYGDEIAKDFTVNGSYFYTGSDTENKNRTRNEVFLPEESFTSTSEAETRDDRFAHNANLELEYKIDSLTTIGITPKMVRGESKYKSASASSTINQDGRLAKDSSGERDSQTDTYTLATGMFYNRAFKKKGRFLNVNANLESNQTEADDKNISFNNFYEDLDDDGITDATRTDNRNQIESERNLQENYNAEIEYSEPLKDSIALQFAMGWDYKQNVQDRGTFDYDPGSQTYSVFNDSLTSYMRSGQRTITPKVGLNINREKFQLNIDLGTAATHFEANSVYLGESTAISRDYLFPFAQLWGGYNFTKSKSLWINYQYEVDFASAREFLPVEDYSNPQNTIVGNPDLDPNQSHYLYLSFRNYDYATKSGYSLYGGGSIYDSQIVSSTTYDDSRKGLTQFVNVSGTASMWMGGNWSKSIKREAHSFRYGIGVNSGFDQNQGFINGQKFDSESWRITPRINFSYDYGELLSISPKYDFTYRESNYSNYVIDQATNLTHRFTLQTTSYWPKHVVFGNDFSYTYNSNIADGFKKDFYLWNMSLGYNFLSDKLLAKVKIYDLLDQNQNSTRTINATSIVDEENVVLKRYAMFSLTYKLEKFGGKKKSRFDFN